VAKKDNNIRTAFFLNLAFTVLEVTGGLISGSIAILSDIDTKHTNIDLKSSD
tara:strand:- start:18741 stop:18896 length:156 start_codon:yes stop_codon:yes gene_type:complete